MKRLIAMTALATLLAGCGGSGGGDSTSTLPDITSVGVITGFGSITVTDVRYGTENSRIVSADDGSVIIENSSVTIE